MGQFLETSELESLNDTKLIRLVDPLCIKWLPVMDFKIDACGEKVSDGDWDRNLELFSKSSCFRAINDVFLYGIPWNETDFYSGRLHKTPILDECDREEYKRRRCNYLNYLFNSMREFGYVQDPNSDLVGLLIGRNGEVILNNGRHRVAIAQVLGIPLIPVVIDVRHSGWVAFCDKVYDYAKRHGGRIYQPVDHPDLCTIPSRQGRRIDDIVASMNPNMQTMLDLGANWGRMCQQLEQYGVHCTAVEFDQEELFFLRKLRSIYEANYDIVEADIVDFMSKRQSFDCVMMLSVLHHISEDKREMVLGNINAKEMYFQFPSKLELELDIAEWIKSILNATCFKRVEAIGPLEDRELFHFKR